jgi:hypothetical protein
VSLRNDEMIRRLSRDFHNEFYGGGGTERCGGRALFVTEQHCKAQAITERRNQMLLSDDPDTASTLQPPPTAAHSPCVDSPSGGGRDFFNTATPVAKGIAV